MHIAKKILSGLCSTLEWYDYALYGYFSPIIAELFFPSKIYTNSLLYALGTFAIGFIARPLGALIFGRLGDKYGRVAILKATPILITTPTFLLAILPTYDQIGFVSPLLLIALRIIQGFCVGAEYATNITFLCEHESKNRTYFMGSIGSCIASSGIFLASLIASLCTLLLSSSLLIEWGWRMAFLLSLPLGITSLFIRRTIIESSIYQNLIKNKNEINNPLSYIFLLKKRKLLLALGLSFLPAISFYYIFTFLPSFLSSILNLKAYSVYSTSAVSLFARLMIIPILGYLADKVGGIKIARLSSFLFLILSYPLLYEILQRNHIILVLMVLAALTTLNAATTPGLLIELIPSNVRCTILSIALNISFGIFGGITPALCLSLISLTKNNLAPAYLLIFASIITLLTTFFSQKETTLNEK